jgi:hypothetical protein
MVAMNNGGRILIDKQPLNWVLFNRLLHLRRDSRPAAHGNFLPALQKALGKGISVVSVRVRVRVRVRILG